MAYKEELNGSADTLLTDDSVDTLIDELKNETVTDDISTDVDLQSDEYTPQFADVTEDAGLFVEQPKPKKKKVIYLPIIISAIIVLGALLGYFIFVTFIAPSEEGTWTYTGSDGMTYYYTFDDTADGGIVTMSVGTVYYYGSYETSVTEESNNMYVSMYAGEIADEFTYTVDGYKLFNNATLTLTNGDTTITLTQAKRPKVSELIKVADNHKTDEKLLGDWEFNFEEYGIKYSVTFNEDGTMLLNQFDMINYYCVYTVEDSVVKFSFYGDEIIDNEIPYSFKDNQLIFMDLNWTKVDPASKDEA